jgi:phage terminase small subunit
MTPKQAQFAEQYVLDHCGAAAAVRAGYAPGAARQTAYELLAKPQVQALVAEYEAAAAKQLALSRERVISEIKAAIAMAREQRDPAAMIAGWREIAKLCGYYAPERRRIEVSTGHDALRVQFESMSDAELIGIAAGG